MDDRAFHTVPPELRLGTSTVKGAGTGVYATTFIPRYTWLGEYEGETILSQDQISDYAFKVSEM